jgi:hypothetical protein
MALSEEELDKLSIEVANFIEGKFPREFAIVLTVFSRETQYIRVIPCLTDMEGAEKILQYAANNLPDADLCRIEPKPKSVN